MRIPATLALVPALVLIVAGCGLKKDKTEELAGAIDAASVVSQPGAPTGKNAAGVARFATEVAMDEPKMIGQTATPRTSPSGGTVVATLKTGTIVTRIATNAGHSLIVFPDPNVPADNLMGWVTDAAFSAAIIPKKDAGVVDAGPVVVDAGPPPVVDAGPAPWKATACTKAANTAVKQPNGAWACRHTCASNADCTKGKKTCEQADVYNPDPTKPAPAPIKVCHDDQ